MQAAISPHQIDRRDARSVGDLYRDTLFSRFAHYAPVTISQMFKGDRLSDTDRGELKSVTYRALLKAATGYKPGRGASFSSWAITIMRKEIWQEYKRMAKAKAMLLLDAPDSGSVAESAPLVDLLADDRESADIERAIIDEESRRRLWERVEALPARQAAILREYYLEETPLSVIAERLGVSLALCR